MSILGILLIVGMIVLSLEFSLFVCWKLRLFDGRWFPKSIRKFYMKDKPIQEKK